MSTGLIFLLLCSFAVFFEPTAGTCTVSKYNGAYGNWVKCWGNATLDEAMKKGGFVVAAITISNARITNVPASAFASYTKSLQSLILMNCAIRDLHPNALMGLTFLKKLHLPHNNLTIVQSRWFDSLMSLEQLDLSFNAIKNIDPSVFAKLTNLRRLNLDYNQLTCLEPTSMLPMRSITKIRLIENPLSFMCRARMTLWFDDKGINYVRDLDQKSDKWLDRILWLCAQDDYVPTYTELQMRQCLLLNIFNQLRSALKNPGKSFGECKTQRKIFNNCIVDKGRGRSNVTNGEAIMDMIIALRGAQQYLNIPLTSSAVKP